MACQIGLATSGLIHYQMLNHWTRPTIKRNLSSQARVGLDLQPSLYTQDLLSGYFFTL